MGTNNAVYLFGQKHQIEQTVAGLLVPLGMWGHAHTACFVTYGNRSKSKASDKSHSKGRKDNRKMK